MTEKTLDRSGRWRDRTVGFRMSAPEAEALDTMVAMSGLTKQDYIINKLLDHRFSVVPNSRVQKALRQNMELVYLQMRRIEESAHLTPELGDGVEALAEVFVGLGEDADEPEPDQEDLAIKNMRRC